VWIDGVPENSFEAADRAKAAGLHGVEFDLRLSKDGELVVSHDPTLDRTTDGKGSIKDQSWVGGIEHVRTKKLPVQPIPRFDELIELLMEPENRHVVLNIDCKIENDPDVLFPLIAEIISKYFNFETELSPCFILGLWHPLFLLPAKRHLPTLDRFHIGISTSLAREYFWSDCVGFSIAFPMLVTADGQQFLKDCKKQGKEVTVWTVNEREEMIVSAGWGVKAVLTDKVGFFVGVRKEFEDDKSKLQLPLMRRIAFPWSSWKYYTLAHMTALKLVYIKLTTQAYLPGPFEEVLDKQRQGLAIQSVAPGIAEASTIVAAAA